MYVNVTEGQLLTFHFLFLYIYSQCIFMTHNTSFIRQSGFLLGGHMTRYADQSHDIDANLNL